jgi:hypothetical protein
MLRLSIFVTVVHHLGEGCEYDAQCSSELGQTQCEHNQCQCADGATLNKETNTCSKFHI